MQQLAMYGDDTDTDESVASSPIAIPDAGLYSKQSDTTHSAFLQTNYFGLDAVKPGSGKHDVDTQSAAGSSCDEKHVQLGDAEAQIPDGDFWRDFTVSDTEEIEPRMPVFYKRKADDFLESQPQMKLKRNESDRVAENVVGGPWEKLSPVSKTDSPSSIYGAGKSLTDSSSDTSTALTSAWHNDPSVKIYSVHPKITPHLISSQANRCPSNESHYWAGHSGVVNRLAWCSSPSFSHLLLSASMDTTVRVWNVWAQHQPCVRILTVHRKAVRDAQWSGDGRSILSCSYDRTAAITDVQTGQSPVCLEHSSFVSAGKFHPVSPHLLATGTTDCIQLWDTRNPDVPYRVFMYKGQLGQVQDLAFSADGQELFSSSDMVTRDSADRSIMAWDLRTGVILSNQIFQERYTVTRLCLHPTTPQFLAQTQAGYVAVFSTQRPYKMNRNKRFEGHKSAGYNIGMSVSRDGSLVYSGCAQGKVHCYNFQTSKRLRMLDCGDVVLDVASHPVLPSVVAAATWGGMLHLFQ